MRFLFASVLLAAAFGARAQFDLGAGLGGYVYELTSGSGNGGTEASFSSDQAFPFTASLVYRERLPTNGNLFTEFSYVRKCFTGHFSNGGLGGGSDLDVDVKLDVLYLSFGPEFGTRKTTFRAGLQCGKVLGGRMVGHKGGWGMGPPYHSYTDTVPPTRDIPFSGDVRVLLAFRWCTGITESYRLMLDPYASVALSGMYDDHCMKGIDLGMRVGVLRQFKPRGAWQRLRAGPLRVRMKEG